MPVRTGVIGVGVMGAEHARLLSSTVSGSEVVAVFDIDESRAEQVAADCGAGIAGVRDDPLLLIKDDGIDAVVIASSDATHEELVLACLAAGKPVLCEKPLAPDSVGCERIVAAEAGLGHRLVSVGFMRRFDPEYRMLKAELGAGAIGTALLVHCVHRNAELVGVTSPSLISGSAVHELDVVRWLLDDEPAAISVHRPRPSAKAGGAQDPVVLVVEMACGVLVDIEVFVNAGYGYDVRTELVGESGTLSIGEPRDTVRRSAGVVSRPVHHDWRDRFAAAYQRELQDWVHAVANGRSSQAATAWDGYTATAVATAGIAALEDDARQPITLIDRPELYA
jgi:myo-inositol 2-dehydrogenase/D-chiro-inositol 1-dehydrogenase